MRTQRLTDGARILQSCSRRGHDPVDPSSLGLGPYPAVRLSSGVSTRAAPAPARAGAFKPNTGASAHARRVHAQQALRLKAEKAPAATVRPRGRRLPRATPPTPLRVAAFTMAGSYPAHTASQRPLAECYGGEFAGVTLGQWSAARKNRPRRRCGPRHFSPSKGSPPSTARGGRWLRPCAVRARWPRPPPPPSAHQGGQGRRGAGGRGALESGAAAAGAGRLQRGRGRKILV